MSKRVEALLTSIIGINEDGMRVFTGYDTPETSRATEYGDQNPTHPECWSHTDEVVTAEERRMLAEHMIARWRTWASRGDEATKGGGA